MTNCLIVTKPGKPITSTNSLDYIIDTRKGTAIIYKESEVSVVINANSSTKSIVNYPITFDFAPTVELYVELTPGSKRWYYCPFTFTGPSDPEDIYLIQTDTTNHLDTAVEKSKFYVTFYNPTGSQVTLKYRYYIYCLSS